MTYEDVRKLLVDNDSDSDSDEAVNSEYLLPVDECLLAAEYQATINPLWARSLIGLKLKVPGYWWPGYKRDRELYEGTIVRVDHTSKTDQFFIFECEGND